MTMQATICDTCTDALDDTSCLTLADHVCDGGGCSCRCQTIPRGPVCGYCGKPYTGSFMAHLNNEPDPKHNA